MRWLAAAILYLLAALPAAAQPCSVSGPQDVPSPFITSGVDANCNLTFRQLGSNELNSPFPFSTSGSTVTLGFGQMRIALDNNFGFAIGQTVQVWDRSDPEVYVIGAISGYDPVQDIAIVNILVPYPGAAVSSALNVLVLGGSSINGVPVWAGLTIDGTTSVTNPSAPGQIVTLQGEVGKAYTDFSNVYVWAPQDQTYQTWFLGTVLTYNSETGVMTVFVRRTPNNGQTYSLNYISLVDLSGPDAAISGYSSTPIGGGAKARMAMGMPGAVRGGAGGSFPTAGTVVTLATQASQFFPIDGQVLASCLSSNIAVRIAGQVKAYSSGNLLIRVTSTFGNLGCSAWGIILTTGPTTRISTYQFNGLQVTFNNPNLTVQAGSARDSSDAVDLVLPAAVTMNLNTSPNNVMVTKAGTATMTSCGTITGSGTAFLTDFSLAGTLTDFNNQLTSQGLPTITRATLYSSPFVGFLGNSTAYPVNASVGSNTSMHVATGASCGGTQYTAQTYARGGFLQIGVGASAGIILARKDSDGTTGIFTSSFTPSGQPDLAPGYTYYRVLAVWDTVVFSQQNSITQPLGTVISGPGAPGQTLVTDGVHWGPSSLGMRAMWQGVVQPTTLGFNASNVNTSTGLITFGTPFPGGVATGTSIEVTGTAPTGVTVNTGYYICVQSSTTLFLYNTTEADAIACGSTGKVIPSGTGVAWSFRYLAFTTVISINFDSVTPIGRNPGSTTQHWDFNLANGVSTSNCLLRLSADNIFNTTPAAAFYWIFEPWQRNLTPTINYQCTNSNLVSYVGAALSVNTNLNQGTWAQQGTTSEQWEVQLWAQ